MADRRPQGGRTAGHSSTRPGWPPSSGSSDQPWATARLFFGGRSAGARVACRTADQIGVAGVVCLAFPLHLPGRPDRPGPPSCSARPCPGWCCRAPDALAVRRDPVGPRRRARGSPLVDLPGADHGISSRRRRRRRLHRRRRCARRWSSQVGRGFRRPARCAAETTGGEYLRSDDVAPDMPMFVDSLADTASFAARRYSRT